MKEYLQEAASALFCDTRVRICTGRKYLGALIGDDLGKRQYLQSKCEKFFDMVDKISTIAQSEPHAANSGYVVSLQRKWGYLQRVLNAEDATFDSLDSTVNKKFVINLFKGPVNTDIRDLTSLSVRMGGMAIEKPNNDVALTYQNSQQNFTEQILKQEVSLSYEEAQISKADIRRQNNEAHERTKLSALKKSGTELRAMMKYTNEKGANHWLTNRPDKEKGLVLSRSDFRDAIRMRYAIRLNNLPTKCVCSANYIYSHALRCSTSGFVSKRHNDLRDIIVGVAQQVCVDVNSEPSLLSVLQGADIRRNTSEGARLDVSAIGFWRYGQRVFFDVRVFNPLALSNTAVNPITVYKKHEQEKINMYRSRVIDIEQGSFTSLVFSCFGGASPLTSKVLHR